MKRLVQVTFDAAADTEADALPEDSEGEALQRGAVTTENEGQAQPKSVQARFSHVLKYD